MGCHGRTTWPKRNGQILCTVWKTNCQLTELIPHNTYMIIYVISNTTIPYESVLIYKCCIMLPHLLTLTASVRKSPLYEVCLFIFGRGNSDYLVFGVYCYKYLLFSRQNMKWRQSSLEIRGIPVTWSGNQPIAWFWSIKTWPTEDSLTLAACRQCRSVWQRLKPAILGVWKRLDDTNVGINK